MPEAEIRVYIPDATYPLGEEGAEGELLSSAFRRGLEAEYGLTFNQANIGPGFDIPAFVAQIPFAAWIGAALVGGKLLEESLDAYLRMYRRLRAFFPRNAVFDRAGSILVGLGRVVAQHEVEIQTLRVLGYKSIQSYIENDRKELGTELGFEADPPSLNLGVITHVIDVEVDGRVYRVFVTGSDAVVEQTPSS